MWRLNLFLCGTGAPLAIRCLTKAESSQIRAGAPSQGTKTELGKGEINHVAGAGAFAIVPPISRLQGSLMAHESDYQPGSMDINAHKKAYAGFLTGTKWTFGFIMLIMIFLAIFRTH
jgi:hypothetical protein